MHITTLALTQDGATPEDQCQHAAFSSVFWVNDTHQADLPRHKCLA